MVLMDGGCGVEGYQSTSRAICVGSNAAAEGHMESRTQIAGRVGLAAA